MLTTREISALMRSVAEVVREHVGMVVAKFNTRFQEIEDRIAAIPQGEKGERGERGERGEPGQAIQGPRGQSAYELAIDRGFKGTPDEWLMTLRGEDGRDGDSVDFEEVAKLIRDEVEKTVPTREELKTWIADAVSKLTLPQGEKGERGEPGPTPDIEPVMEQVREFIEASQAAVDEQISSVKTFMRELPVPKDGRDGRDVSPELVTELIKAHVKTYVDELRDDTFVNVELVNKLIDERRPEVDMGFVNDLVAKAIEAIPLPKDGRDGKDGEDGKDGTSVSLDEIKSHLENYAATWALDFEKRAHDVLQRTIDRMPLPKDGADGKDGVDGRDGFGFDSFECEYDGLRTIQLVFKRGEEEKRFPVVMPIPLFKDIFKAELEYDRGDMVIFDGSLWIAQRDTQTARPGNTPNWRMVARRGRDGKDGEKGERGEKGEPGMNGRDLTQMGPDGQKW